MRYEERIFIRGATTKNPLTLQTFRPPASEDDGVDGNAFLTLPQRVYDRTLAGGGTEAGIGMSARTGTSFKKERNVSF